MPDDLESGKRSVLRHALATLAYRGGKAVRNAPDEFATFRIGDSTRTPAQILAHIGDLLDWGLSLARGAQRWEPAEPRAWSEEVARFHEALSRFDEFLASDAPLGRAPEVLFQAPIADALTHVGQLTMLRRLAGAAVRGENYAKAEIVTGRLGAEQAVSKYEFD